MENLLRPLLAGLICGFVVSIPVGPVNLTVINHALRKGFGNAFLIGAGAILAETFYATLMLWGHASILDEPRIVLALRIIAVVVITGLGIRYVCFKPSRLDVSKVTAEKVEERWHHPRSFFLGFVLTISNFMLVVLWATLVTLLYAHDWVDPERQKSRFLCAMGIFLGGLTWFALLAFFVSRAHRRVKNETLLLLVRGCGVLFLVFAVLLAYKLFV
ncbi:MAG TPA: LysE family transporter [Verrucomicrobiae bacterium]|nr:LysE family transporter [Verrucomicrobiae bacterium]